MTDIVIEQTKQWLEDIVIGHNFCPFAKKEFVRGSIRFRQFEPQDNSASEKKGRFAHLNTKKKAFSSTERLIEQSITLLMREIDYLDNQPKIETTLLVFDKYFDDFYMFLDLIDIANQLIDDSGYSGTYQLATFHPDYLFEGEATTDASHYTNRSPYPMLHLLREVSMERVLEQYPEPDNIPTQNIEKARSLGVNYFKQYLQKIRQS